MSDTTFTEIDRDYHESSFPASRETIVIRIEGELADRVRRRFSREGAVEIWQHGKEDVNGTEYASVQWIWDSVLSIGGAVARIERADTPVLQYDGSRESYRVSTSGTTKMARWLIELEQVGA